MADKVVALTNLYRRLEASVTLSLAAPQDTWSEFPATSVKKINSPKLGETLSVAELPG